MSDSTLGIIIIICFIILGFVTRGAIFHNSPVLVPAHNTTVNTTDTGPDADTIAAARNQQTADEQLSLIHAQAVNLNKRVNQLTEEENASPYKNIVSISGVYQPGNFDEYVSLFANPRFGQSITLTGWKLRSTVTGDTITIGGAANIPDFNQTTNAPIVITGQSSFVTVSVGRSPLGYSLRLNRCTGFLDPDNLFNPFLPRSCPLPYTDAPALSNSIDNKCLDYIESLSSCTVYKERDLPEDLSRSCKRYIETYVNYDSCVENHRLDTNFYTGEWRVYANNHGTFGLERRDKIQLIDNLGLVVDSYEID